MQKKGLPLCVALALSGNTWADTDVTTKQIKCPSDINVLSQKEKAKLPAACLTQESSFMEDNWGWVMGSVAAIATVVGIAAENNDRSNHHSGNTPVPPDNTPVPPDDGGTPPTPPATSDIITFANGITVDKKQQTLAVDGVVWSYAKNTDNTYLLTKVNDSTKTVTLLNWEVVGEDTNLTPEVSTQTLVLSGITDGGNTQWSYGNTISNTGNISADSAGATGSKITGNHNTIDTTGETKGSYGGIGTEVDGNNNTINNQGGSSASDGGTGTYISGDSNTINTAGESTISGQDSIGTKVAGNGNIINNIGKSTVTDGSTGVQITGNDNTLNQTGAMSVGDLSTGLSVTGESNTISLDSPSMTVFGMNATGVSVSGDNNSLTLTGDLTVDKDQKAANAQDAFFTISRGIAVSGANNQVVLDGHLKVIADTERAEHKYAQVDGSTESIQGVSVVGDGHSVILKKGLSMTGEVDQMTDGAAIANQRAGMTAMNTQMVSINGRSSLFIEGESVIDGSFPLNPDTLILGRNGAYIELKDGATFNVGDLSVRDPAAEQLGIMRVEDNSTAVNNGAITLNDRAMLTAGKASNAINNGTIQLGRTKASYSGYMNSPKALDAEEGGQVTNNGTITGKILDVSSVFDKGIRAGITSDTQSNGAISAVQLMGAKLDSSAVNQRSGTLEVYGYGIAMGARDNSTIDNYGAIRTDAQWRAEGDVSELGSDMVNNKSPFSIGAGMAAGHFGYATAGTNAVSTNRQGGTITVSNAGAGMVAYGAGNTVINQGNINLVTNEYYDASEALPLVGMAVYSGGTVINDTTGVININAQNGVAFWSDGNANNRIINRGQINLGEGVPEEANNSAKLALTEFMSGDYISQVGASTTLTKSGGVTEGLVYNAGSVSGGSIGVMANSTLTNENSGNIQTTVNVQIAGSVVNQGQIKEASVQGGTLRNEADGHIGKVGTTTPGSVINNEGTIDNVEQWSSVMHNSGTVTNWKGASSQAALNNQTAGTVGSLTYSAASIVNNAGTITGPIDFNVTGATLNNSGTVKQAGVNDGGTFNNLEGGTATMVSSDSIWKGYFNNWGTVNGNLDVATGSFYHIYNGKTGVINGQISSDTSKDNSSTAVNDGTINITGSNQVAMSVNDASKMVNNGTINLGTEGTTKTGMVGMQLGKNATSNAVIENNGTINIYAGNSYAFSQLGANGRIINNGEVKLECGDASCGFIKQEGKTVEGSNGNTSDKTEVHAVTYTAPTEPTINPASPPQGTPVRSSVSYYTVGTNADGSAGTMSGNYMNLDDVKVGTGFTAGTAATTETFNNVFTGTDIQGEENIQSTSVVWTATGRKDVQGNIDVTMNKNAYTSVVNDSSVNSVAAALDAGYTNNALYNSLNLSTSSDVTKAMKQISGSMANSVARDARVLSNRFDMLADTAPVVKNGLAFNVVAQGDERAELGNNTRYDMMALRQTLEFGHHQTLSMEYGIARLNGDNTNISAGDNGVNGGYSQFFGLSHSMPLGENGLAWENGLRYDIHEFDSTRAIRYGDVNETAKANTSQQYVELRSEGKKTFTVREGFSVVPYAGVKLRHTMEDGYQEKSAGDFNLNMSSSTETAVDSVAGMKLNYAGKNGWSAMAALEGGPNLSYASSGKTAKLQGAAGQRFDVNDGQKGGGINGLAQVNVKYHTGNASASLEAFHWREDGLSDKGLMMNYKLTF